MNLIETKDPAVFLKPKTFKLGKCNFRRYDENIELAPKTNTSKRGNNTETIAPYLDNEDNLIDCTEIEDDVEINTTKNGQYITEVYVAPVFYSILIGAKGQKKREIEADTEAKVLIPRKGETGKIVITGATERSVLSARVRVNMTVLKKREQMSLTHFVSIPVLSDDITRNFEAFKSGVLSGPPMRGVDESIFQETYKFHLTITPLVLLDEVEINLATQTLHECSEKIIRPLFVNAEPLKIVLQGLEIMNDDPTDVNVLYGQVKLNVPKYNTSFQTMANKISEHFAKKGLIVKQYENVKLHVTLMNSIYRFKKNEGGEGGSKTMRESFDASYILNKYKSHYFGETVFDHLELSIRFTARGGKYYEARTCVELQ